ncbi:MAG: tetratricopeptide repeat protein [Bacteroidetes bacterium]|nr:tetratricopeptide repeat protein [Bacteroidota bacterium]
MERRFDGFLAPHGLYVLDTFSGEVRFITHGTELPAELSGIHSGSLNNAIPNPSSLDECKKLQAGFSPFENEVISSYPYLVAKPFLDLVREKDSRMKCKLLVDTFTAVLKYMALQLASEYIRAKDVKDLQLHQTLTKDLSRPLISAWNLLIARCLPVLLDNKVPLFSPEIKEAYEKLETKCKEPFLASHQYSDDNGELKTKTKKLGKIQALINYRNGLAHGFNQTQSRAQKEFNDYYPLLCDILKEVRYMARYTLWHVLPGRQGVEAIRLMGFSPSMNKIDFSQDGVDPSISPLFMINDATGELLPLYAFFDVESVSEEGLPEIGKDVFVFEGNTKNTVIYLSSNGEHLEKSSRFQHWRELLAQKQLEVEWVSTNNLTIEMMHAIGTQISANGIQALISSGKYLREASVPRQELNEMFDSFSYGIFNGFVLGGESGIGKSTLLAQKTEEWQAAGNMVCFYRGSSLNQSDISNKFLRDCALKISYLEDFLSLLDPIFTKYKKKSYLIIDGLNEYAGDLNELIKSVDNMVAQAKDYPWFKIIVSIRDSAYIRVNARFGAIKPQQFYSVDEDRGGEKIKTNIVRLQPIAKEFAEQLYNSYRAYKWQEPGQSDSDGYYKFRPLTVFNELDPNGSTIRLIRNPLMARLVMQSFHRSKLPSNLKNDEAMRLYYNNIVLEKTEVDGGFPERKKFLHLLVTELDKQSSERIDRDELLKIPALRSYLVNTQKDSAYIQLLELGVLMEDWEKENCYVRFAFDKFLEFLLTELYWPRLNDAASLAKLFARAPQYKILQGAIENLIVRFCLNGQPEIMVQSFDLAISELPEIRSFIKEVAVRTLELLSVEDNHLFEQVLKLLPLEPSEIDLEILYKLVNRLYDIGDFKSFSFAMEIAKEEATLLNNQRVLTDLIYQTSNLDALEGRVDQSLEKLDEILPIKKEINDLSGYAKCLKSKATRFYNLGRTQEAEILYLESLHMFQTLENKTGVADCNNSLANLYEMQGKIDEAEKLYLDSITIYDQLKDSNGKATALLNLGDFYLDLGKLKKAEELIQESLEINYKNGLKRGIALSLSKLAALARKQGKSEDAEELYLKALDIRKELGDIKGISGSLLSLGVLYSDMGMYEESKKYYRESMELKRSIGDLRGVSALLNNMSIVHLNCGEFEHSIEVLTEALEIDKKVGNKQGICTRLTNLGVLSIEAGKEKEAIKYLLEAIQYDIELKRKNSLIGDIHRVYSLLDAEKKSQLDKIVQTIDTSELTPKEKTWISDIELLQLCSRQDIIDSSLLIDKAKTITQLTETWKANDIDDLPVESFYVTAKRLIEMGYPNEARSLAERALQWIGERKTIRKNALEVIVRQ